MNLAEAFEMIERGETPDQYKKRNAKLRKLANERDSLEDAISVLGDDPRATKKRERLAEVERQIMAIK